MFTESHSLGDFGWENGVNVFIGANWAAQKLEAFTANWHMAEVREVTDVSFCKEMALANVQRKVDVLQFGF